MPEPQNPPDQPTTPTVASGQPPADPQAAHRAAVMRQVQAELAASSSGAGASNSLEDAYRQKPQPSGAQAYAQQLQQIDQNERELAVLRQQVAEQQSAEAALQGTNLGRAVATTLNGVNQQVADTIGLPGTLSDWVLRKTGLMSSTAHSFYSGQGVEDAFRKLGFINGNVTPQNAFERTLNDVGQGLGAAVVPDAAVLGAGAKGAALLARGEQIASPLIREAATAPGRYLAGSVAAGVGSGLGQSAAQQVAPGNKLAEFLGSVVGGVGGGVGAARFIHEAPTVEAQAARQSVANALTEPPLSIEEVPAIRAPAEPQAEAAADQGGLPATADALSAGDIPPPPPGTPAGSVPVEVDIDKPVSPAPETEMPASDSGKAVEAPSGVSATTLADASAKGPGESSGADGGASAGAKSGGDPWANVDWGQAGSPERAKAALEHLDDLKKFILPEHIQDFVASLDRPEATGSLGEGDRVGAINPRYIDWDHLDSHPEDLLRWANTRAAIFQDLYAGAGDGARSWDSIQRASQVFGTDMATLIKTHADITGQGGIAARVAALTETALEAADKFHGQLGEVRAAMARGDMSGVADFAASVQRLALLESMAEGSVSETARALNYMKRIKAARTNVVGLQAALDTLGDAVNGGRSVDPAQMDAVMDNLDKAYKQRGAAGVVQEVAKVRQLKLADYVSYYVTAGLLSSPKTAIKNFLGTPIHAAFQVAERYVGAGVGAARAAAGYGSVERMTLPEANAYLFAARDAFHDAVRAALKGFTSGQSLHGSSIFGDEVSHPVPFQLTPDRMRQWARDGFTFHTISDAALTSLFEVVRTPGIRTHAAFDAMHKVFTSRMQLAGLAYREAAYRAAQAAPGDYDKVFQATLSAIKDRPTGGAFAKAQQWFTARGMSPEAVYPQGSEAEALALAIRSVDLEKMAADHATMMSFQDSTPAMDKIDAALKVMPVLKWFYVPFFKTPWNLLKAGLLDRNPATLGLVGRNREALGRLIASSQSEDTALQRGGAEGDLALARLMVGGGFLSAGLGLWASGGLVGRRGEPGSPQNLDGVGEYSLRLPDGRWVQYSPMDPVIGTHLGLIADLGQTLRDHKLTDDQGMALVGGVLAAIKNNVLNKSTLSGIKDFFDTFYGEGGGETDKTLGAQAERGVARSAVNFYPLSSLARSMTQSLDPVKRDARTLLDQMQAITPGWSQYLPAMRDSFGRPVVRQPGASGPLAAFPVTDETSDPLDAEEARLGRAVPDFTLRPEPRRFNGQPISAEEYSRVLQVQGQLYTDRRTGWNMEEAALNLIGSEPYAAAGDLRRSQMLKDLTTRYRLMADRAIRDPRSPFYMADMVDRTGEAELQHEAAAKSFQGGRLESRGRQMGLSPEEVQKSRQVLGAP